MRSIESTVTKPYFGLLTQTFLIGTESGKHKIQTWKLVIVVTLNKETK